MKARALRSVLLPLAAALIAAATTSSCAYYNTLYNARKIYREAERSAAAGSQQREQREKYRLVVEKCAKVITEYPKSRWVDDAVFLMGMALLKQEEYDKSIRKFREILTNFPESGYVPQARYRLGEAHYRKGDHRLALAEVERFLADYPRHELRFETLFLGGDIQRALENDEAAIAYYGRAADAAKGQELIDEARMRSAELFYERGDWERAAANYERVLRKGLSRERRYKISLALGECYANTGKCREALYLLDDLLEKTTAAQEVPPILLGRAAAFSCMDSIGDALAVYDKVITRYPRSAFSAEAYYRKGVLFEERLDSLRGAQESFSRVSGEHAGSKFASVALERGSSMKRLMELEESKGRGQSRDQAAEQAFMSAEIQLTRLGEVVKALKGYRAALDSFPDAAVAPRAAYALAWIHQHKLEHPDTAIALYRALVERYPRSPQVRGALFELGVLGADDLKQRLRAYADSALADTAAAEAERRARGDAAPDTSAAARGGEPAPQEPPQEPAPHWERSEIADSLRPPPERGTPAPPPDTSRVAPGGNP